MDAPQHYYFRAILHYLGRITCINDKCINKTYSYCNQCKFLCKLCYNLSNNLLFTYSCLLCKQAFCAIHIKQHDKAHKLLFRKYIDLSNINAHDNLIIDDHLRCIVQNDLLYMRQYIKHFALNSITIKIHNSTISKSIINVLSISMIHDKWLKEVNLCNSNFFLGRE